METVLSEFLGASIELIADSIVSILAGGVMSIVPLPPFLAHSFDSVSFFPCVAWNVDMGFFWRRSRTSGCLSD